MAIIIDLFISISICIGVSFLNFYLPLGLYFLNNNKQKSYVPVSLPTTSERIASFLTGSKRLNNMLENPKLKNHPMIIQLTDWFHPSLTQEQKKQIELEFKQNLLFFGRLYCLSIPFISLMLIIFLYFLNVLSYRMVGFVALIHIFLGFPCWYHWSQSKQDLRMIEMNRRGPYYWVKNNLLTISMAQVIDVYDFASTTTNEFDNVMPHQQQLNQQKNSLNHHEHVSDITSPPSAML